MLKIAIPKTDSETEQKDKMLQQLQSFVKPKNKTAFRIHLGDEVLVMPSGKSVWGRKGDAKSALWNAMTYFVHRLHGQEYWKEDVQTRKAKIEKAKKILFSLVEIKELK
jgi:hypothetical protein